MGLWQEGHAIGLLFPPTLPRVGIFQETLKDVQVHAIVHSNKKHNTHTEGTPSKIRHYMLPEWEYSCI